MSNKNPVVVGVLEVPGVENFSSLQNVSLSNVDLSKVHQVVAHSGSEEGSSEVAVTESGFPDSQEIIVEITGSGEVEVNVSVA